MDEVYFKLDELKSEKQKETFEYSIKMAKLNKNYKLLLAENGIFPDKNKTSNTYLRKYLREIFDEAPYIVEFFTNEMLEEENMKIKGNEKNKVFKVLEENKEEYNIKKKEKKSKKDNNK